MTFGTPEGGSMEEPPKIVYDRWSAEFRKRVAQGAVR